MYDLIKLVSLFPLLGFLITGLSGKYFKKEAVIGSIASAAVGISFILSIYLFSTILGNNEQKPVVVPVYEWISAGNFSINLSYQVDRLSVLFSLIITGVGLLIHIYSIGYMHGDRSFSRFFAYMNLFIFMMLNLVLGSNFLVTFLGWEGVGLCSYLLIGFWYDRKFDGVRITYTGDAANKAFIVNRIGDFGFIIAMFIIYVTFNSLDYQSVMTSAAASHDSLYGTGILTAITLLIFLGCTGKSAQIPLTVWLPDAMAGPTPVSALIHAATMVTGGIFLIARSSVLFALSPISMNVVSFVGILTAIYAATIAITQNDIKKVLAYSTVSQLGFMFAALGVGAFTAGVFHVMTHAFFKGLLFLGAGAVIHGMHDEQNIKKMGGLQQQMPVTYKTFLAATLAISGIPLFSGFFSKDEILWNVYTQSGFIGWLILAIAAFCTAFYMFRLIYLVFKGDPRYDAKHLHPHEAPKVMTIPLIILAILSVVGGFFGIPYILGGWFSPNPSIIENWLEPVFADATEIIRLNSPQVHSLPGIEYLMMLISIIIAIGGIILARKYYSDPAMSIPRKLATNFRFLYRFVFNKYKLDEFYFATVVDPMVKGSRGFLWKFFDTMIIDGLVNGTANITLKAGSYVRMIQSGVVQNYALFMLGGIIIIIAWIVLSL